MRERIEKVRRILKEDASFAGFLKHTGWLTGSSAMAIGFAAVQGIFTARILGVELWGMLAVAIGFSEVVGRLMSFRMNEFVVKWVTHLRADGTDRAATAFKWALAGDVGSSLIAFVIVELLAAWGAATFAKDSDFTWAFRLIAVTLVFKAGQQTLIGMLQVNRDFKSQGLIQTAAMAASAAGMVVVWLLGGGLTGVIAVLIMSAALASALFWTWSMRAARKVLGPGWIRLKMVPFDGLGREMMTFAILGNLRGTLGSLMNDGDLLILGYFGNPAQVSYYKLAKSIAQIAALPNMPLVGAAYPEFADAAAESAWHKFRSLIRRGTKVAALWVVPVSVGLLLLARPAISLLYGQSFLPATPVLAVLLVGIIIDAMTFWGGPALLSLGEPGRVATVAFWGTLVKLALAFLLVPKGGSVAMAAAQSVALLGMNAAVTWFTFASLRKRQAVSVA